MGEAGRHDRELRERAERVLPGGVGGHLSTRLLPEGYPQFYVRGKGARLWDADGRAYVDFLCGYGPNLLGYGHPAVDAAFAEQLARGDTLSGPSPLLVELAETLVAQVSHAAWAIFCKNGTDATTLALMVARAHTGRRKVVLAKGSYHGSAPWCTPVPAGTLPEDRAHQIHHRYGDAEDLERAVRAAGADLAAVVASPFRHDAFVDQSLPSAEYAARARALCDETGALLVVDEVRAGFRLARDASWRQLGVDPDLTSWGKALANGHALSALLGAETARAAASRLYVTGSFWGQAAPMAAALATLREIRGGDYLERLVHAGERLREGLHAQAAAHGYVLRQSGPPQMPQILFDGDPDFRRGFAFCEEAQRRGVLLHPWHNMFLCAAHGDAEIDEALAATDEAFAALRRREATLSAPAALAGLLPRH